MSSKNKRAIVHIICTSTGRIQWQCLGRTYQKQNIDQIERVQRRAARFVKSSYGRDQSVTCMIMELGWPLLRERRARAKVTIIFKAKKDMIDIRLDMPNTLSSLRSATAQNHFIPFAHTNVYLFSFYQSALRIWNGLPPSIRESTTLANFQSAIKGRILTPPDQTCYRCPRSQFYSFFRPPMLQI